MSTYVHVAHSEWDGRKKRSRQRRLYIGRLTANGKGVELTKKFSGPRKTVVKMAGIRQRLGDLEGLQAWLCEQGGVGGQPTDTALPAGIVARVLTVGDLHVLLALAERLGMSDILRESFGEADGTALLALALFQAGSGHAYYRAAAWLGEREMPFDVRMPLVSEEGIYGLLARTGADADAREGFLRRWIARHKGESALLYDTTSISTYSALLETAEWGHNRDGESLPQINLALAANAESGIPLYYRTTPGSIPDVRNLSASVDFMEDFGVSGVMLSLDRGFYSQANMRDLLHRGHDAIIGVPWSVKQARAALQSFKRALESPKRTMAFGDDVLRHAGLDWPVAMGLGADGKEDVRMLDAHLFLDLKRRAARVVETEKGVHGLIEKSGRERFATPREALLWRSENAGALAGCIGIRTDNDSWRLCLKPHRLAALTSRMGYTLVVCSRRGEARESVLANYRGRDKVEKLYDALKNENGQNRLRTGHVDSAEGRLLVAFLAVAVRSELERSIRGASLPRGITTAKILDEMAKVKAVYTQSGKRVLLEVTKRQRECLVLLNIKEIK